MANELPTLETLQATYGYNDPRAYQQAQENQGLAQQFQQQNLAQEANKTQEGFLANQQSTAMNPLLVDQQRGVNTTRGITNQTSQLGLDRANALQFQNLAKDQQQAILDMKENDIKAIEQHGRQLSYSNDPNERAQGQQIYEMGQTFRAAKQEQDYKVALEQEKGRQRILETGAAGANASRIEQMGIDAGKYKRGTGGAGGVSFVQKLSSMKVPEQVSATYAILQSGVSPDTQQPLTDIEKTFFQSLYDQGARTIEAKTAAAGQGTKLDINEGKAQLVNKVPPSVRPPEGPQVNSTKSGTKFKVISQ